MFEGCREDDDDEEDEEDFLCLKFLIGKFWGFMSKAWAENEEIC